MYSLTATVRTPGMYRVASAQAAVSPVNSPTPTPRSRDIRQFVKDQLRDFKFHQAARAAKRSAENAKRRDAEVRKWWGYGNKSGVA